MYFCLFAWIQIKIIFLYFNSVLLRCQTKSLGRLISVHKVQIFWEGHKNIVHLPLLRIFELYCTLNLSQCNDDNLVTKIKSCNMLYFTLLGMYFCLFAWILIKILFLYVVIWILYWWNKIYRVILDPSFLDSDIIHTHSKSIHGLGFRVIKCVQLNLHETHI